MSDTRFPAVFYFSFNLDPAFHEGAPAAVPPHALDEENTVTYAFAGYTEADDVARLADDIVELEEWYEDILTDCEGEYGVHDWCSGPDDRILCLGGYNSYEVEPARVMELMSIWRDRLAASPELKATFGHIVPVTTEDLSDWEIYSAATEAGSTPS